MFLPTLRISPSVPGPSSSFSIPPHKRRLWPRDEKRAPLKTPAWEAMVPYANAKTCRTSKRKTSHVTSIYRAIKGITKRSRSKCQSNDSHKDKNTMGFLIPVLRFMVSLAAKINNWHKMIFLKGSFWKFICGYNLGQNLLRHIT